MGWKDWVYGDLVSAADFQSLVQDQTVQRYASSSARSAALGSAVAEGMVSYLDDTNAVEVYNGSGWNSLSGGSGNVLINGSFDFWQRSTSAAISADAAYIAPDRFKSIWASGGTGSATWSQQTFTPGTAPVAGYEGRFFSRQSVTSGSGTTEVGLAQWVEDVRTFAGQSATLSFWAKADSARTLTLNLQQRFGTGGSGSVNKSNTQAITTSWARYTYTVALDSVAGKTISTTDSSLAAFIYLAGGQASGSAILDIWGVQLEAGSSATPFKRNAPSIQGELAACQRYYAKSYSQGTLPGTATGTGAYTMVVGTNTTNYLVTAVRFPVTMRTAPTIVSYDYAGASGKVYKGGNGKTAFVSAISDSGEQHGTADGTSANELAFHYTADAEL